MDRDVHGRKLFQQYSPDECNGLPLVQCVFEPKSLGLSQESSSLDSVIAHKTKDFAYIKLLSLLANSDHDALSFMFRARDIVYDLVRLRSNVSRASITAEQECVATTDWSVSTRSSIEGK